jgi:hypothetical protein
MDYQKLLSFLINSAFGASAVRNQGKGMIQPIRDALTEHFDAEEFFKKINAKSKIPFKEYLDFLTKKLDNKKGYYYNIIKKKKRKIYTQDNIPWGTARKCINLFLRNFVYNAFIWKKYRIRSSDFRFNGPFNKLELPLDSYSVAGLKAESCLEDRIKYSSNLSKFTITKLNPRRSRRLQDLATLVSKEKKICRINLDVIFWRSENNLLA